MQKKRHERPFRTQVGGACNLLSFFKMNIIPAHIPINMEIQFVFLIWLGRLADELRTEQEHGLAADKANKMMASQCTEMQSRLADVEAMALRHGKKIIAKLEERCRALEDELGK